MCVDPRTTVLTMCVDAGMATVVWYAMGGQLDADELHEEVVRELEKKKKGGLIKRGVKSAFGKKN
jgi:iron transport multicopper oxidase